MKCPHCLTTIHFGGNNVKVCEASHGQGYWNVSYDTCPECTEKILYLVLYGIPEEKKNIAHMAYLEELSRTLILPKTCKRFVAPEVPEEYKKDYQEAALILHDSPQASAALSRRCLQHLIREKAQISERSLDMEIQKLIDSNTLPPYIANSIDGIRNIGNFAAHPQKSLQTGEILPVEIGEAEWTLDVLDDLFEFYFIAPALSARKINALNAKLTEAGKPLMKSN